MKRIIEGTIIVGRSEHYCEDGEFIVFIVVTDKQDCYEVLQIVCSFDEEGYPCLNWSTGFVERTTFSFTARDFTVTDLDADSHESARTFEWLPPEDPLLQHAGTEGNPIGEVVLALIGDYEEAIQSKQHAIDTDKRAIDAGLFEPEGVEMHEQIISWLSEEIQDLRGVVDFLNRTVINWTIVEQYRGLAGQGR